MTTPAPVIPSHVVFVRDPECTHFTEDARETADGVLVCDVCSRPIQKRLCPQNSKEKR